MIWFILLIPIIIACLAKFVFKLDICWKEFPIQIIAGCLVLTIIWSVGFFSKAGDHEVLNGAVISKNVERERCYTNMMASVCENSYGCNYRQVCTTTTDSKGNATQSCHMENDTCYVYDWEQDWNVRTSVGSFEIRRVDKQGAVEPSRYTQVKPGDPASRTHPYNNWAKASVDTIFKDGASVQDKYVGKLPAYPIEIYDYYKIKRAVQVNTNLPNIKAWNDEISFTASLLGQSKQMNLIVVFANNVDSDYAYALRYHWEGFKKNDAVIFIGMNNNTISWVDSLSWSKNPAYDIRIRQQLALYKGKNISELNPVDIMQQVRYIANNNFERRPMKEFEYLKGDITPPTWLIWTSIIIAILMGVGLSIFFHKNECFEQNYFKTRNY